MSATRLLDRSRFLAVALLVAGIGIASTLAIAPWWSWRASLQEQIADQRALLGRYLAVVAEERRAGELLSGQSRVTSDTRLYLSGATDALRAAQLQARLAELAREIGVRFETVRGLQAAERSDIRLLGVEARFTATTEALQRLLQAIETAEPFLLVRVLQLNADSEGRRREREREQDVRINVRMEVQGLVPKGAG